MLAGQRPFPGEGTAVAQYHASAQAPLASSVATGQRIPTEIDGLIAQLLSKDPDNRPASAAEVARRLQSAAPKLPRINPLKRRIVWKPRSPKHKPRI